MVKNLPADTRSTEDSGLIPGLGKSSRSKYWAICSNILAWKIPQTEEPSKLKSMVSQGVR